MKKKQPTHPLLQPVHPNLSVAVLAGVALVAIGLFVYVNSPAVRQSGQVPTTPTDTPIPLKGPKVTYHVNNTGQWATYASPDIPISIQFPPQWQYYDGSDVVPGGGKPDIYVTDTQKRGSAPYVIFSPVSTQDGSDSDGVYIAWGGSYGDPNGCTAHPSIQLKDEVLSACEYTLTGDIDKMQIDKVTPTLNLIIRTTASNPTTKAEILQILSTLSFTK
jgi:hypothetical protein